MKIKNMNWNNNMIQVEIVDYSKTTNCNIKNEILKGLQEEGKTNAKTYEELIKELFNEFQPQIQNLINQSIDSINIVTSDENGFMSYVDKIKLDNLPDISAIDLSDIENLFRSDN